MYGQGRGGGLGPIKSQLSTVENECRSVAQGAEGLDRDVAGLAAEVNRQVAGTVTGMDEETALRERGQRGIARCGRRAQRRGRCDEPVVRDSVVPSDIQVIAGHISVW